MLDVDAAALSCLAGWPISLDVVVGDHGFLRITSPDAANPVLRKAVADKTVAEAKGHLDPMRRGIGEVIAHQQIVIVALPTIGKAWLRGCRLAQRFAPGKPKE